MSDTVYVRMDKTDKHYTNVYQIELDGLKNCVMEYLTHDGTCIQDHGGFELTHDELKELDPKHRIFDFGTFELGVTYKGETIS